ncbi:MAG TPA: MarC family protein [Steroidobacteraceae bacterium]
MSTWTSFLLALTALLPLINPIGSALIFLGLVGDEPSRVYHQLARKIAMTTFVFLVVIEFGGSLLLDFFGISLPIIQLTGGLVIAATAWTLLFEKDAGSHAQGKHQEIADSLPDEADNLDAKVFYPFTFPLTAGPGSLAVMVTLSAHATGTGLLSRLQEHIGIILAVVALSASVYVCYAYAPKLIKAISPATVHGLLRIIAFILMCIGVQIAWNGLAQSVTKLMLH